ncbi:hypothetical protein WN943_028799 [Citrus x changshan-huyou]
MILLYSHALEILFFLRRCSKYFWHLCREALDHLKSSLGADHHGKSSFLWLLTDDNTVTVMKYILPRH